MIKLSKDEKGLGKTKFLQKKEVILILTVLLFATYSYAACDITDTLDKGESESYTAGGKDYTIKFSSLTNESGSLAVKFEVNGALTSALEKGNKYIFDDLSEITISDIIQGSGSVNDSSQICFNAGLSGKKGTCSSTTDCEDNNPCTIDECDGDPLRCKHKLILWCRSNDGCCPQSKCTYDKDKDCPMETFWVNESDNLTSLISGFVEEIQNETNETILPVCLSGDSYCPKNCNFTLDSDCDECSINDDCNDNNACTSDSCSGTPKVCFNNATSGCNFNGTCIYVGKIMGDQFCSNYNSMKPLKLKEESCDYNYECVSSICKNKVCKGKSLFNSITSWFKGLFGK